MTNRTQYPRSLSSPEGFFNFLPTSYIARPPRLAHRRSMATHQHPENSNQESTNSQSLASGLSLVPHLVDPQTLRSSWNNVVQETINAVARVRNNAETGGTHPMSMSSWLHSRSHRPSLLAIASEAGGTQTTAAAEHSLGMNTGEATTANPNQVVLDLQYIDRTPNENIVQLHTSNAKLDLTVVNRSPESGAQSPTSNGDAPSPSRGTPPVPPTPPPLPTGDSSPTADPGVEPDPAANPEETTADILRQNPEATAFLVGFFKYLPFIVILLAKAFYDHIYGIFLLVALFATFRFYNVLVKRSASQVDQQTKLPLVFGLVHLLVTIVVFYLICAKDQLYKVLIFVPPNNNEQLKNLVQLIWTIIISDFIIKLCTIIIKILLTLFPSVILPTTRRGKWYLFIELTSQFYRSLVPIQLWLFYLMESYQSHQKVVGVFLSAAYIVAKGSNIMQVAKAWWKSFTKLLDNIQLGVSPTKETLLGVGAICPICHDEFKAPVQLTCHHVFCESCVSKWFDREQTCPLCRAKLVDDPSWRDGATSYFVQLF